MDDLQYLRKEKLCLNYLYSIVLNLVINGWPSIPYTQNNVGRIELWVLNLVINGWPSILSC